MSAIIGPGFRRVRKLCAIQTHEQNAAGSKEDVIFNIDRFPELGIRPGDLVQISAVAEPPPTRNAEKRTPSAAKDASSASTLRAAGSDSERPATSRRVGPQIVTYDENGNTILGPKDGDPQRSFVFVVREMTEEQKQKHQGLQISLSHTIANAFGLKKWTQGLIEVVNEDDHAASHVEITFRDQYLSRADMWRLAIAVLSQRTVYRDQKLLFLDTIKATVKNVYMNGQRKRSGFFGSTTKPIFRSESARFVVFIQMSKEMWEFDVEGGEIMFNKVVNGFLPELFKNWISIQARHLVSVVMFSRVEYEPAEGDSSQPPFRDFYRVVVNDMSSHEWVNILYSLKKEFRTFLRDITVQATDAAQDLSDSTPECIIVGKPSVASKGNILEAISLASTQFSRDYIDRDLIRTGISVVVVTAGSGIYEVGYSLLKQTTDTLISSGTGIDLVCLAPMPLHSVPLFKYKNPKLLYPDSVMHTRPTSTDNTPRQSDMAQLLRSRNYDSKTLVEAELSPGEWSYSIPHWLDVSFWKGTADEQAALLLSRSQKPTRSRDRFLRDRPFSLRCILYELEMMGLMENELPNIGVSLLHDHPLHPWHKMRHRITGRPLAEIDRPGLAQLERDWMEDYDEHTFKPVHERLAVEEAARKNLHIADERPVSRSGRNVAEQYAPKAPESRAGSGYLEWNMGRDAKPTQRRSSILSLTSNADRASIMSRSSAFSRQPSIGAPSLAAPKEDFSMGIADVRSTAPSVPEPKPRASMASRYFEQFRAALTRPILPKETVSKEVKIKESTTENHSKPINIDRARNAAIHSRSSSDDQIGSVETVKGNQNYPKRPPLRAENSGAILFAASSTRRVGLKPNLSSSGEPPNMPTTLSPVSALAPWLVLVNPSNPRKNNFNINSQFRRWQHVFPRQLRVSSMKWKSLCSPASVPLTNDFFPTAEQLEHEYRESPYKIAQQDDEDLIEMPKSGESLIRELIAFRLAHGFQLVVGPAVASFIGRSSELVNIFDKNYMARNGATVFMSLGNTIHQLLCLAGGEVEVRRFTRKPSAEVEPSEEYDLLSYRPYIRTVLSPTYEPRVISFKNRQSEYNWNFIDSFLAGHGDQFSDSLRFWRARFVFIPVEIHGKRHIQTSADDSEEEIRLEGIRKLTHIWLRHRVYSQEERGYQSVRRRKDPNPLMIDYQTRDPSAVIAAGPESLQLTEGEATALEADSYSTENIDLLKLAQDLQGDSGVRMIDRRWHLKLYSNCFIGSDLTSWLLARFRDIDTRDEAVTYGNELMGQGMFQHVQGKHQFRDGNFFYQIIGEYRTPSSDSRGWFIRRDKGSMPPTPSDASRSPYTPEHSRPRPTSRASDGSDEKSITFSEPVRRRVVLSSVMRYNVDWRKRSCHREIINLHYDRLHSPDNCYHFRIDWMNVTAKFIEDAVVQWAAHGKKFGLKLVEVPIAEACSIATTHPFRATTRIKLAIAPPAALLGGGEDAASADGPLAPLARTDPLAVHKAILKRLNFVLDVEAAASFPDDVDVVYSWGQNDYRYAQYIHRSGSTLAQITDAGDFLLLANRLYSSRSSSSVTIASAVAGAAAAGGAPGSPALRPVTAEGPQRDDRAAPPPPAPLTAEVKAEVERFCADEAALLAFYDEFRRSPSAAAVAATAASAAAAGAAAGRHYPAGGLFDPAAASPSPRVGAGLTPSAMPHVLDAHIPALRLPPKGVPETGGGAGP
jgi:hypothetical protein